MKTYVLIVSRQFPAGHPKAGQPTGFVEKILAGEKIHTIRQNWQLWQRRVNRVRRGEAVISLRYWEGKPYKSKQIEFKKISYHDKPNIHTSSAYYIRKDSPSYARNDGLSEDDFIAWFSKFKDNELLGIIFFTSTIQR